MLKNKHLLIVPLILLLVLGSVSFVGAQEDQKVYKIGLVLAPGGLGDKSFNDQAFEGVLMAKDDFPIDYKVMEPMEANEIQSMHRNLCENGFDMIVANGYEHVEAVKQLSGEYPDVKWTIIDVVVDKPNVLSVMYNTHTGSFMAGSLAGLMTESDKVGFVGGMEIPLIKKFFQGYKEGVKYVNEDAEILETYVGSTNSAWNNPVKGNQIAKSQFNNGADIVYHAAGGSGTGVIKAAEEEDLYAIGVNFNQDKLAPGNVLTSMLTKGEVAIYNSIEKLVNGNWEGGKTMFMTLENGGVGLTDFPYTDDIIPEEVKNRLEEIKKKITSGEISVTDYTKQN